MRQFFITALEKDGSTTKNGWIDLGDSYVYGKTYKKNNDRIWFKYDKDKDGFFEIEQPNHHKIEENFSLR